MAEGMLCTWSLMWFLILIFDFRVVEYANYDDMKNAMKKLDGAELNGRKLKLVEDYRGRRRRYVELGEVCTFIYIFLSLSPELLVEAGPDLALDHEAGAAVARETADNLARTPETSGLAHTPETGGLAAGATRETAPGNGIPETVLDREIGPALEIVLAQETVLIPGRGLVQGVGADRENARTTERTSRSLIMRKKKRVVLIAPSLARRLLHS